MGPEQGPIFNTTWTGAPVAIGIVADRELTRASLSKVLADYPEFILLGVESGDEEDSELLRHRDLQLLVVNLVLEYRNGRSAAIDYVRRAKQARPDIRLLLLKRQSEENLVRESLDAGADGCCLQAIPTPRLALAIKAVADGAAWLDPGISDMILHGSAGYPPPAQSYSGNGSRNGRAVAAYHLSPREQQILRLLSEGLTNDEISSTLTCSTATVKTHLTHIFRKLGVSDRVSAVVTALRHALI